MAYANLSKEDAACNRILSNWDYVKTFLPPPLPNQFLDYNDIPAKVLAFFAAFCAAISVCLIIFVGVHHKNPVVMAASTNFCLVILFGSILTYAAVFMFLGEPTVALCCLRPLLLCLGFSTMYGYLLVKTFRIWRIFKKPFAKSNLWLSDRNLAIFGALITIVEVVCGSALSSSLPFF